MAARNTYKVPMKQWRKWSPLARLTFNRCYRWIKNNQKLVTHPKSKTATREHWNTIAWNAAWLGADATDDDMPTKVVTVRRRKRAA